MSTLKYKDSVSKLLELFPEFKDTDGYEMIKDELYLAYIVFTQFMDYIVNILENDGENNQIILRFVNFVNETLNDPEIDPDTKDLFQIEFFEKLTLPESRVQFAKKNFTGKALEQFNLVNDWRPKK